MPHISFEIIFIVIGICFVRGNSFPELGTENDADSNLKVDDFYSDESDQEFDFVEKMIFVTDVDVWKQAK